MFDRQKFAACVRAKRGVRGLREVANEIQDVSVSTLSRLENGKQVKLETILAVCEWLELSPEEFMPVKTRSPYALSAYDQIEVLLRSETHFSDELVLALMTIMKILDDRKLVKKAE